MHIYTCSILHDRIWFVCFYCRCLCYFIYYSLSHWHWLTLQFAFSCTYNVKGWALITSSSPESISHHSNCCPIQRQLSTEGHNITAIKMWWWMGWSIHCCILFSLPSHCPSGLIISRKSCTYLDRELRETKLYSYGTHHIWMSRTLDSLFSKLENLHESSNDIVYTFTLVSKWWPVTCSSTGMLNN